MWEELLVTLEIGARIKFEKILTQTNKKSISGIIRSGNLERMVFLRYYSTSPQSIITVRDVSNHEIIHRIGTHGILQRSQLSLLMLN